MDNRREFLRKAISTTALAGIVRTPAIAQNLHQNKRSGGVTILFQGDSITDGNRTRNTDWNHVMGHGYAYSVASKLWYENPSKELHFLNRGISGNKITDLQARWQTDTMDLKPNWISILVGINDISNFIKGNAEYTAEQFEAVYRSLLQQTLVKLPDTRFVLCEPFILPVGKVKENWKVYEAEVSKRQEIVKRLALEFDGIHVPFQTAFNDALTKAPADYWIWDGIHPMPAGHELMARLWIEKVSGSLGIF